MALTTSFTQYIKDHRIDLCQTGNDFSKPSYRLLTKIKNMSYLAEWTCPSHPSPTLPRHDSPSSKISDKEDKTQLTTTKHSQSNKLPGRAGG